MGRKTELEDLMDETLMEILVRTPTNTAHVCKCVSKRWLSLISHPYFLKLYYHHNTNITPKDLVLIANFCGQLRVLSDNGDRDHHPLQQRLSSSFDLTHPRKSFYPRIYSVSHDLVLIGCHREFFVCNPFNNLAIRLPPLEVEDEDERMVVHPIGPDMFLACVCNDNYPTLYKVVLLTKVPCNGEKLDEITMHMYIFSSDNTSNKWSSRILVRPPPNFTRDTIHWEAIGQDITTLDGILYCCGINMIFVCNPFDLNQQRYFIDLPEDAKFPYVDPLMVHEHYLNLRRACITTVEQHLRLYAWKYFSPCSQDKLLIWDLIASNHDTCTWSIKHYVDLSSINWSLRHQAYSIMCIKGFNLHDKDILYVLSLEKYTQLLAVNLRSKTVQVVSDIDDPTTGAMICCYAPRLWPTPVTVNYQRHQYSC